MARKLPDDPVGTVQPGKSAAQEAADELQVLHPELTVPVGGEQVVVREYDFWTSMDIIYSRRAFLDDAIALLSESKLDPWEAVRGLFGRHAAYLKSAAAVATGRDVPWVESLTPRETDTLMSAWWAVNGHFFLHEAVVVMRGRAVKSRLTGPTSSSHSATPDSATSTASDATPNDS